jgi:glycosyltransferase involved in cell wall biosynthesis
LAISALEVGPLREFFPFLPPDKVRAIPLGAPEEIADADPDAFRGAYGVTGDFVVSVARLEPHKNQLALIRALKGSGRQLVLIGSPRHNPDYAAQCRAEADATVRFIDRLPEPLLWSAYAGARVFALPSHYEVFGLAALEAAAGGARVVCARESGVRECLGERALYVAPDSVADIRAKVEAAWQNPTDRAEQQRFVLGEYSWRRVAERFLAVYRECVQGGPPNPPELGGAWMVGSPNPSEVGGANLESQERAHDLPGLWRGGGSRGVP